MTLERPVLVGRGLTKRYGDVTAIDGVDIDVWRGSSIALTGPSGAGKTTLLHVLAGIIRPDEGSVTLEGVRIDSAPDRERSRLRRRHFGFVFQEGYLVPELTAVENVALPLMLLGHPKAKALREAYRWFEPFGLEGLEHRRPGELSGGQAQRVAIARAIITGPSVVFADEPTAALDSETTHRTMSLLESAVRHANAGLVVVTHDPEVAARCDVQISILDGRLRKAA